MRLLIQEEGVEGRTFDEYGDDELILFGTGRLPPGARTEHEGQLMRAIMAANNYGRQKDTFQVEQELKGRTTEEIELTWRALHLKWTGNHRKVYDIQNGPAILLLGQSIRELTKLCYEEGTRKLEAKYANNNPK